MSSSDSTNPPQHDPLRAAAQHVGQQWHQVQQHWQQHVVPALHNAQAAVHYALATHPLTAHMQRCVARATPLNAHHMPPSSMTAAPAPRTCFASVSAPAAPSLPPDEDEATPSQLSAEAEAEWRAYIEKLTDEEREQLAGELWESILKETKVKVDGRKTTLWELKEEV